MNVMFVMFHPGIVEGEKSPNHEDDESYDVNDPDNTTVGKGKKPLSHKKSTKSKRKSSGKAKVPKKEMCKATKDAVISLIETFVPSVKFFLFSLPAQHYKDLLSVIIQEGSGCGKSNILNLRLQEAFQTLSMDDNSHDNNGSLVSRSSQR